MLGKTALEALKIVSVVVADTGDFSAIASLHPQDATTNPSLILTAAQQPQYQHLVKDAIAYAQSKKLVKEALIDTICDRLLINFGKSILEIIPGVVSAEIDAMLSFNTTASVEKARKLIQMFQEVGVPKDRVLIKLASTWEGIRAAEILEREGIHCNLTLLFSMCQAVAAAEAKATLISPFVGRILDWHVANARTQKQDPMPDFTGANDPGVQSVTRIYNYYKQFGYKTIVMGASFRSVEEVLSLAGCDKLTISPKLLNELDRMPCPAEGFPVCLNAEKAKQDTSLTKISIDETTFRWMLNEDQMATEKLSQGIRQFHGDMLKLRQFISSLLK